MLKHGFFLLAGCLIASGPFSARAAVPDVTAAYFRTPPVIDGKLDEACWNSAGKASGFQSTVPRASIKEQTIVSVGYDTSHLYIGFECLESRIGEVVEEYRKDGQSIWLDDCIEVFVSPHATADSTNYAHFGVNVAGTKSAERAADGPSQMNWTARTSRTSDRWFVEMAIPFSTLRPIGTNDGFWRVNFCRNEHPSNDAYSVWSPIDSTFHDFWRFGRLLPQPGAPGFAPIRGSRPALLSGPDTTSRELNPQTPEIAQPDTPIIPAPRQQRTLPGRFAISSRTQIVVGDHITAMDRRAAEEISQEARKVLGYELPVVPASRMAPGRPAILVGEPWLNPQVKRYCAANKRIVTRSSPGAEGYILEATPKTVVVAGSDQAGTFWGAQTLRQMIRSAGNGQGYLKCAQIRDWPRFHYRGVHLLTCTDGLAFHGKCIEDMFSRYKINEIILEAENVRWDSHPEVYNPDRGMSKADVRRLIEIARQHHITVTPLIQSLGHMEWAFLKGQHLDLAEDTGTPYAFCPLNEDGYRFMFDIMDEAIDLFGHPAYMHIGHDEITNAGRFPVHEACRRIGKYRLYVDDIRRYYEHLKQKRVGTMIWGDVFTREGYSDQMGRLPKDIVICDWRYSGVKEYPSLDFYKSAGFPIIGCTWSRPDNLYYFSAEGDKRNIRGMCQTTWTGFNPSDKVLASDYHQIYSYILGAEWAWSPRLRQFDQMPYDPEFVASRDFGVSYKMDARNRFYSVPLGHSANATRTDRKAFVGWLGLAPCEDLSHLPEGSWTFKGIPYHIGPVDAASVIVLRGSYSTRELATAVRGIPVGRKVSALHFLQATGWEAGLDQVVGRYVIHYQDDTQMAIPLHYGSEIKSWRDDLSTSQAHPVAWRGQTALKMPIAMRTFTWTNPSPEKEVVSVDFEAGDTDAAPILVAMTAETPR